MYLYTTGNSLSKYFGAGTIRPNYIPGNVLSANGTGGIAGDACNSVKTNNLSGYTRSLASPGSSSSTRWFNTACFLPPTSPGPNGTTLTGANAYAFGNEPRTDDAIKSSGVDNFDFSVVKSTPIHEDLALQFRVEFFNIFNRVQFGPPVTAADNALFGTVSNQANQPRLIQGAVRLNF